MDRLIVLCGIISLTLLTAFVLGLIFAYPVMVFWNSALVGAVSGVSHISFWQAFEIMMLCNLLFKSNSNLKSKV